MRNLMRRYMAPEGDPPTGGGGGGNPPAPAPAPAPETFSKEYVHELRKENQGYRLKFQESEGKAKAAEEAASKANTDADAKVKAAQEAADQRVIRAELKAAALKAGMVDLDGLKLADLSGVKLNEAGEVEGAEALMEALKKSKPYLFGAPSTSTHGDPPKPKNPEAKKATEMTEEEYRVAREAAVRGKR
ncbi:hypothetical protein C3Z06_06770 [Cupriavidus metallidurans]|nr:hypothetical protein C3Z06_06770 [Cupriavidus metallidurans]